jgi:phosphoribosylanthranilate isomerase
MSVIVKICGITNLPDALAAAQAGADAIGFVFYPQSPRYIEIQAAALIARSVPPHLTKVGVFVDASEDLVVRAASDCGLNILQFHGNETPEYCLQFGLLSMKAFRISGPESLKRLSSFQTDAWLLDAYVPNKLGGTGDTFNWELAIEARKMGRPVFLAGGLTPTNVADAVGLVLPYGVDVSSGVEQSPGKKDHARIRAFVQAAKAEAKAA